MLALAIALVVAAGAPADRAAAEVEREATIRSYLGVIDRPVTAEDWRALGPEAVPILARIARDPGALPTRRALALEGLAALGGAEAEAVHLEALAAPGPRLVRTNAIRGLGRILPAARLAREVAPLLADRDARLRVTVAEVLSARAPAEACGAIRAAAARERDARLAKAVERCLR